MGSRYFKFCREIKTAFRLKIHCTTPNTARRESLKNSINSTLANASSSVKAKVTYESEGYGSPRRDMVDKCAPGWYSMKKWTKKSPDFSGRSVLLRTLPDYEMVGMVRNAIPVQCSALLAL